MSRHLENDCGNRLRRNTVETELWRTCTRAFRCSHWGLSPVDNLPDAVQMSPCELSLSHCRAARAFRTMPMRLTISARVAAFAGVIVALCASDAAAAQARPDGCSQHVLNLAKKLKVATKEPRAEISAEAHGGRIRVTCPTRGYPVITLSHPSEIPPRAFYDVVADILAFATGMSAAQTRRGAHRCHRLAKRTHDGRSHRRLQSFRLECVRDESLSTFTLRSLAAGWRCARTPNRRFTILGALKAARTTRLVGPHGFTLPFHSPPLRRPFRFNPLPHIQRQVPCSHNAPSVRICPDSAFLMLQWRAAFRVNCRALSHQLTAAQGECRSQESLRPDHLRRRTTQYRWRI
jgi:hypothetical protein